MAWILFRLLSGGGPHRPMCVCQSFDQGLGICSWGRGGCSGWGRGGVNISIFYLVYIFIWQDPGPTHCVVSHTYSVGLPKRAPSVKPSYSFAPSPGKLGT